MTNSPYLIFGVSVVCALTMFALAPISFESEWSSGINGAIGATVGLLLGVAIKKLGK